MSSIVSSTPGRIRVRNKVLKNTEHHTTLIEALFDIDGVTGVEVNPVTGSLLIHYDAESVATEEVENMIDAMVESEPEKIGAAYRRQASINRYAKYGMLTSLGASLAFAAAGNKRAHIMTGGVFLACLGVHLYYYRQRILS